MTLRRGDLHEIQWRPILTPRHAPGRVFQRSPVDRIDAASALDDLRLPPSHRLEALVGNRAGQWSIRINDQWRICFVWHDGDAVEVEITDYH